MKKERQSLIDAVWKKALGYTSTESVEEYGVQDGQLVVSKQKVTTKDVAPDIAAAKLIMEEMEIDPYSALSDNELQEEKERLLKLLKSSADNHSNQINRNDKPDNQSSKAKLKKEEN